MSAGHGVYIDVIEVAPDGVTHTYWSDYCRHGNHDACSATAVSGIQAVETPLDGGDWLSTRTPVLTERKAAQCETCAAPCVCSCHDESPTEDAAARTVAEPHTYRRRSPTVRAIRWTGRNEAEIVTLVGPDTFAVVEDCADDPDATAAVRSAKHGGTWQLMYDFDWVVECSGGWTRASAEEFTAEFEVGP